MGQSGKLRQRGQFRNDPAAVLISQMAEAVAEPGFGNGPGLAGMEKRVALVFLLLDAALRICRPLRHMLLAGGLQRAQRLFQQAEDFIGLARQVDVRAIAAHRVAGEERIGPHLDHGAVLATVALGDHPWCLRVDHQNHIGVSEPDAGISPGEQGIMGAQGNLGAPVFHQRDRPFAHQTIEARKAFRRSGAALGEDDRVSGAGDCLGCAGDIFPDWRIADRLLRRASLQRGLIDGKGFAQWLTR